jgi:transposase
MTHIHGLDRGQLLLLPEAIDDYVATDNPVRFIDAFVEGLDLRVAGFERVEPKATGRPGYAPGDLLKLYIYGYLNGCGRAAVLRPNVIATLRSSGCYGA